MIKKRTSFGSRFCFLMRRAACSRQRAQSLFAPYLQENSRIILNPLNPKYVGVPEPAVRTKDVVQSGRLVDFKNQPMLIRVFFEGS